MRPINNKTLVIAFRTGRLGNRLVLFAHVIGFAAEHGCRVVNFAFHSSAHLFENTRRDIYCRYPVAPRRSLFDLVTGVAAAIRKTRIFYQAIRQAGVFNNHFPLLANACSRSGRSPDRRSCWMPRKYNPKWPGPELFSCTAGGFVRRNPSGGTPISSGNISDRSKSMNRPAARRWNNCGRRRTSSSVFMSGWETIGSGKGANFTFQFRNT